VDENKANASETHKLVTDSNITVNLEWFFTPFGVLNYKFVSGTPGMSVLPEEVVAMTPDSYHFTSRSGSYTPAEPAGKSYVTPGGTWTFTGYDSDDFSFEDGKIDVFKTLGRTVLVNGTWTFTQAKYSVVHSFVSGTPGQTLPAAVTDLIPKAYTGAYGDKVSAEAPSMTTVNVSDGTWTFKGYDKDSAVINEAGVRFTGTWVFTPAPAIASPKTGRNGNDAETGGALISLALAAGLTAALITVLAKRRKDDGQ
jgi:hypothetical protein